MDYYLKTTGILLGSWIILLIVTSLLTWFWCWINDIKESKPNPILKLIAWLLGFPLYYPEKWCYYNSKINPSSIVKSWSDPSMGVISMIELVVRSILFMIFAPLMFIFWQITLIMIGLITLAFLLRYLIRCTKIKGH